MRQHRRESALFAILSLEAKDIHGEFDGRVVEAMINACFAVMPASPQKTRFDQELSNTPCATTGLLGKMTTYRLLKAEMVLMLPRNSGKKAGLVFPMDSRNKKVEWTLGTTRQVLNRQFTF